ncbi:MAG: hypothetical protein IJ985_07420, partial [Akkermansia sp.]|nr:hypothetical protein [Akkermansia sp.]
DDIALAERRKLGINQSLQFGITHLYCFGLMLPIFLQGPFSGGYQGATTPPDEKPMGHSTESPPSYQAFFLLKRKYFQKK